MKSGLGVVLASLLASQAVSCPSELGALALASDDKAATEAFVTFDKPSVSAPFDLILEFCGGVDADVRFDATMPAHQHGMNYDVVITPISDGMFLVENVVFHMPGVWELSVDARSLEKTTTFRREVLVE